MENSRKPASSMVTRLGDPSIAGLVLRMIVIGMVQLLVLVALIGVSQAGLIRSGIGDLVLVFCVMLACQWVGQIVAERPQGTDWVMIRLIGSLAARTLFPLIFVLVTDTVSERGFLDRILPSLMIFYFVGLILSLAQHLLQHRDSASSVSNGSSTS